MTRFSQGCVMLNALNSDPGRPKGYSRRRGQRGESGIAPWPYAPDQTSRPPASLPGGRPWPKISVVIPLLDSGSSVEETILSILHQEYPQLELVIIGSSRRDETPPLIAEYQQYVVYDVCEPGRGPGHALNKGLKIACGDILTWLGGDDYLASGALHAVALAQAQAEADVITGVCQLHHNGDAEQQHVTSYARGPLRLDELLDFENRWLPNAFLYQPGMMFTRDIWQRAGGSVSCEHSTAISYDLWLRFAKLRARLQVIGRPVVWSSMDSAQTVVNKSGYDSALAEVRYTFLRRFRYDWAKRPLRQVSARQRWVLVNDRAFEYGAGIAHQNTTEILRRAGHDVHLVATGQIHHGESKTAFVDEVVDSIALHTPEVVLVGNLHGSAHGTDVLDAICRKFETVAVLHDFWLLTGRCIYPGTSRRYLDGCDTSCDCPYGSPDTSPQAISSSWQRKRECLQASKQLSLFATSQWMSEKVREALAVQGAPGESGKPLCHWLRCGLDVHKFQPRDQKLCRDLLGLPRDRFIVLTSGDSLSDPRKGLHHLTAALEQLQLEDVLVVALGWFQHNEELPIPNMRAMGYIHNRTRLALLFAAADIFVGASLDEVFGQVFVEAAACGTPSVGYPIGGVPEALVHGVTGLLAADVGPSFLADRINELYRNPAYRKDLGRWARMHVESEWSYAAAYYQLVQGLRDAGVERRLGLSPHIAMQPYCPEQKESSQSIELLGDLCDSPGGGTFGAGVSQPQPPAQAIQLDQRTPLYRGPGNVGYEIVTILPRGSMVDPVALFGEFVQVRWQQGRTTQEGFLPRTALPKLPPDLPKLSGRQLPGIGRIIVPSYTSLVFDLPSDRYHRYPVFGSATRVAGSLTLGVALDVTVTADADSDASNGIYFGNDRSGFAFVYQNQGWNFFHYVEGSIVFGKQVWKAPVQRNEFSIRLSDGGRSVSVCLPTGHTVHYDLGDALFANSDTAYLSVQVAPGSIVELRAASIQAMPDGRFENALDWTMAPPLRRLAANHGVTFGTLPDGGWLGSELDHQLLSTHANLLVWHLDWDDHVNLITSTRLAFARANNMRVRAHPLIWHKHLPSWLEHGDFTPAELSGLMDKRITSLMSRHAADEWVVVNEAVPCDRANGEFVDNVFYRNFGAEYVDMAFHFARAADPKAVLLYNEDGIETPGPKADRCYRLIREMLRRGVPLDGLGMQFHLLTRTGDIPAREQIVANLARFADLGLDLYVTELDVNLVHLQASPQDKLAIQAQLYRDVVESCLATGICKSVTTWGFNDRASWLYDEPCGGEDPLLFDRYDRVKPAFIAIQKALS